MSLNLEERLITIEGRLGVQFKNRRLLLSALTHRSYHNEYDVDWDDYELLEFLGDAVIELCVTEHLVRRFSEATEGLLTNYRAALVRAETLGEIGERLGLFELMLFSRGQQQEGTVNVKVRQYLLSCAVEAIIGAVHLDQGPGAARFLVDHLILSSLSAIIKESQDPITDFQELAQGRFRQTPEYRIVGRQGPDHKPVFRVAVCLGSRQVAVGEGASKKEARVAAAQAALITLQPNRKENFA